MYWSNIVRNSYANLKFNSFPLQSLMLGFSINTFLSYSKYLIYFTGIKMIILLSNYRNILVIRWQYNKLFYFLLYYKEIQLSLLIKPHRHPKNVLYPSDSNIKSDIALYITIGFWKVDSFSQVTLIKENSYQQWLRTHYCTKFCSPSVVSYCTTNDHTIDNILDSNWHNKRHPINL